MRLERLEDGDIADYVVARFADTGRSTGEALNPLVSTAKGHPQRAMLLAHRLWNVVAPGETATLESWERAHADALEELDAEFDARWRGYDLAEQKTLRAVIAGDGSPYRERALGPLDLSKATAQSALERLEATADIEREGSRRVLVDPLFAEWVARL